MRVVGGGAERSGVVGSGRRVRLPVGFEAFPRDALSGSIPDRFAEIVRRHGDRAAVVASDGTLSYEALAARSAAVAGTLADAVPGRAPVALLLGLSTALPVATLGALGAARPYVALDPDAPDARLARTIERSGASAILASAETMAVAQRVAGSSTVVLDVDAAAPGGVPPAPPRPDDLAYVYYTSGSTGEPKGVEDTHRNVLHNVMRYANTLGLGPGDRLTLLQRPAFSGSVSSLFGALLTGATSCPFDIRAEGIAALRRWLADERLTVYHSVPSIFREVASAAASYTEMRVVRLEGDRAAPLDLELFDRHFRPGCVLVNGLGATECGLVRQYVHAVGDPIPEIVPVGYPVEDVEVAVVDDHGCERAAGVAGEVVVRSAFLARRYRGDPGRTASRFADLEDGRRSYRTGDRGRLASDGCLELLGRIDSQPRFRGQQVEVEAIEQALVGASLAAQVAVLTHQRPGGRERLVAYVVPPAGASASVSEMRALLERELPRDTVPTDVVLLDALPMDENGKITGDLPPPAPERPTLEVPYVAPRGPLEALVAAVWADVLDLDRVGVRDPFRALGGDSLQAAEMLAGLEHRLDVTLPQTILIDASTVEELAQRIARTGSDPNPVTRVRDGRLPTLVLATGDILGGGLYVRDLAARLGPDRPVIAVAPFDPEHEETPATFEEMAQSRLALLLPLLREPGRCIVAGYCGPGGLLACELARGLARAGITVQTLILIDTFPPTPFSAYGRALPVRLAAAIVRSSLRIAPSLRRRVVAHRARAALVALDDGQAYSGWPKAPALAAFLRARILYQARPLPFGIHVLWPADEIRHPSVAQFRRGWEFLATTVEVTPVPGDHLDVVTRTVDDLAAALRNVLAAGEVAGRGRPS